MSARLVFAIVWALLGLGLVGEGIYEVSQWASDPVLAGSSLRWWNSTGIVPGALALIFSYQLLAGHRTAGYLGLFLASALTLYVLYILALTPSEHIVRPMLALQIFVVALCIGTGMFFYRNRQRQPPAR